MLKLGRYYVDSSWKQVKVDARSVGLVTLDPLCILILLTYNCRCVCA